MSNTPNSPHVYNVTITTADTEYSQALPNNTKRLTIYAVDSNRRYNHSDALKVYFTSNVTNNMIIVPPAGVNYDGQASDGSFTIDNVNLSGTLYFQSPTGSAVAVIIAWT